MDEGWIEVNVLDMGAAALARAIAKRDVTSAEVVDAHIRRIEEVNPAINAMIATTFASARYAATAADSYIERNGTDGLPPLMGVPVTIKDCWPVEGVVFTSGSWYHRGEIATEDAVVVTRLREAGAIVLGKTNTPDMCWGFETVNPIYGRTRNPRDLSRSAGGSSGGEGAIIAAGGSPLGVGSDIGGSVRNPAAINGIVSLKPTAGRIPTDGHMPAATGEIHSWNNAGPLARRVEDLTLALSVLADEPPLEMPALNGVRCVVTVRTGPYFANKAVKETVLAAAGALSSAGMELGENNSLPIDRLGILYTSLVNRYAMSEVEKDLGGGTKYSFFKELFRGFRGQTRISREALAVAAYIKLGAPLARLRGDDSFERLEEHKQTILDAIGDGVLLCPLLLTKPPKHGATWTPFSQIPFATPFNATGLPAAIVPVRWTTDGLPLAVQVVGKDGADDMVLAVAEELEKAFGGWRPAGLTGDRK